MFQNTSFYFRGDQPGYQHTDDDGLFNYAADHPDVFQWELRVCDVLGRCDSDKTAEFIFPGTTVTMSTLWPICNCIIFVTLHIFEYLCIIGTRIIHTCHIVYLYIYI